MVNKLKCFIALVFVTCIVCYSTAKDRTRNDSLFVPHGNVIKMRLLAPVLGLVAIKVEGVEKMFGFGYERVITKKMSFDLSLDIEKIHRNSFSGYGNNGYSLEKSIIIDPEYRFYPFNKNKKFPQGFHIGPSLTFGILNFQYFYYQSTKDATGYEWYSKNIASKSELYKGVVMGTGGKFGWQYFIGKRKRFNLDISLGAFACKSIFLSPDQKYTFTGFQKEYADHGYFLKVVPSFYLGYTFGKMN
jgi:hypothetical protein